MQVHLTTLALAACFAAPPATASGGDPVVETPRNATVSPRYIVDKATGSPVVWVTYDGYQPRRAPGKDDPSGAPPLGFMKPYPYAAEYQSGSDTYLLLVQADAETRKVTQKIGWVSSRYVLRSNHALRDPATRIFRKGMIVNTAFSLKQGQPLEKAPILLTPEPTAKPNREFSLSNIYFIYAETDPADPVKGYALLGAAPYFNQTEGLRNPASVRELVLGWVPKSRVCLWSTREALEWDTDSTLPTARPRRKKTGHVYRTIDDAKKALKGQKAEHLFEEVFADGVSLPFPYDRTRYPIVAFDRPRGGGTTLSLPLGDNVLRKVGIVGGFVDAGGRPVADLANLEKLQRRIRALADELSTTEVLFVIDDTGSMSEWFKTVAATVESIIESVKKDQSRNVRIAITYFNDVEEGVSLDKAVIARKLVDARSARGQEMVDELKKHRAVDGGDPREQMFHGIKKGVEVAGFQPNARKIVILIGDMADKSNENDPNHAPEKAVREMLLPAGQSPIEFYAVQVVDPESHGDARAFRKQMGTLLGLMRADLVSRYKVKREEAPSRCGYFSSQNKNQVRDKINERYAALRQQAEKLKGESAAAGRGEWTRISPELERILKDQGIDIEPLRKAGGFQLFEYGYVWEKSIEGIPQTRVRLLVSDGELQSFVDVLASLDSNDPGKRTSEKQVITNLVQTHIGELQDRLKVELKDELKREDWSFDSVILRSKGLTAKSPLLKRAIDDIKDDAITSRERQDVLRKKKMLEDVRNNVEYDYQQREVGETFKIKVWDRVGARRQKQRLFSIGGDNSVKWCWVDFDKEWP